MHHKKKGNISGDTLGVTEHFTPLLFSLLDQHFFLVSTLSLLLASPFWPPASGSPGSYAPPGYCRQSTYSELLLLLWLRGSVGRLESRTWIPRELIARIKIVTIASTGSFSRTITRQRLRRAALTWKEGFSVVAPIRVIVPHST